VHGNQFDSFYLQFNDIRLLLIRLYKNSVIQKPMGSLTILSKAFQFLEGSLGKIIASKINYRNPWAIIKYLYVENLNLKKYITHN
jgi:hypothetical protein